MRTRAKKLQHVVISSAFCPLLFVSSFAFKLADSVVGFCSRKQLRGNSEIERLRLLAFAEKCVQGRI